MAAAAIVALLAFGGCARPLGGCLRPLGGSDATPTAREVVAPDTRVQPLRVGTSGDYAPFSSRAADGTLIGFDVEVARAYAAARGRAVTFVPFRWPDLAARFAAGDFDVVMSGVTVRADRLVAGAMTAAVARAEAVFVVAAGARGDLRTFDRGERTVAVNRGGHLEQVTRARIAHARIVAVDDNESLPELLSTGRADAIVTDSLELTAFEARCATPPPCFRVAARLAHDRKAYWLPRTQSALAADLDVWLLARERDGWLPALRARQLGRAERGSLDAAEARLVDRVVRRMSLMPAVATVKRATGMPIEDRAREAEVERGARARAAAAGLDPDRYAVFVRAEIAAAKAIQRATPADTPVPPALDDLRRAIDDLDAAIVADLATLAPLAAPPNAIAAVLADAELPGLSREVARTIAAAMHRVRRRFDAVSTGRTPPFGGMVGAVFTQQGG